MQQIEETAQKIWNITIHGPSWGAGGKEEVIKLLVSLLRNSDLLFIAQHATDIAQQLNRRKNGEINTRLYRRSSKAKPRNSK